MTTARLGERRVAPVTEEGTTQAAPPDPAAVLASRRFLVLLVLAAAVGLVVSLAAWCFLELIHQIQQGVFHDLPGDLGYHNGPPDWYYLVALGLAGLITGL